MNKKGKKSKKEKKKAGSLAAPVKAESKKDAIVVAPQQQLAPQSLIAQAITQGANVETMEKLMNLQDRWEAKQAKKAFDSAMANFQAECPVIRKTRAAKDDKNKTLYSYAPLDAIVSQVKTLIQKHGFSYAIKTSSEKGLLTATCIVKHELGHSEESSFEVPSTEGTKIMSGPQRAAAALTFAKRYAFCNAFGIMTGDDDTDARETVSNEAGKKKVSPEDTQKRFEEAMSNIDDCEELETLKKWRDNFQKLKEFSDDQKRRFYEKSSAKIDRLAKQHA